MSILTVQAQSITDEDLLKFKTNPRFTAIGSFYRLNHSQFVWLGHPSLQKALRNVLLLSAGIGLEPEDYQFRFLSDFRDGQPLLSKTDSIEADVRWTDAALHLFTEVYQGKAPHFGYNGLAYPSPTAMLLQKLKEGTESGHLVRLFDALQPSTKEYKEAVEKLNRLLQRTRTPAFSEPTITSARVDSTNLPLFVRLYQLAIADTIDRRLPKEAIASQLRSAQVLFNLAPDGMLGPLTRQALNVSLYHRMAELKQFLATTRWLQHLKKEFPVLVLNLPAASFFVYEKEELQLFSKVIVGKPSTPTPTLTSTITEVVLYPYWMVPHKIATRELLPRIKRNIAYLEAGNYQVLNRQGQVLNPYRLNWSSLHAGYFPYIIRQSTGCDNALGLVKFNFVNPFTVYLHDTPGKDLFATPKRFYSHGCMRIEKPVELARFVLGFNRLAIDTLTAKGCLEHQSPLPLPVQKRLPVLVLYNTVWYDEKGSLHFYEDMYNRVGTSLDQSAATLPEHKTVSVEKKKSQMLR